MNTPSTAVTATVIRDTAALPRLSRFAGRGTRALSSGLILLLLAFVAFMGSGGTKPAHAWFGIHNPLCGMMDDNSDGPAPDSYGNGTDSILPLINPVGGKLVNSVSSAPSAPYTKPTTMYEQFGTGGMNFDQYLNHDGDENDGCFPIAAKIENMIANYVFTIPKAITGISISMYQWASSPDLLSNFLHPMDCVVAGCAANGNHGLRDALYLNFLPVLITLGALYMAWIGLVKKRSTEAIQAAVWMVCAAVFSLIFMAHPSAIAQWGNGVVSQVNSAAMTGITQSTAAATPQDDPCYLPGDAATKTGTRMAACSIYKAFLFTPWAAGQFGSTNPDALPHVTNPFVTLENVKGDSPPAALRKAPAYAASDIRVEMLYATAMTHDEAAIPGDYTHGEAQNELWKRIQTEMKKHDYSAWRGNHPLGRVSIAFAALIASAVGSVLIILISFSIVVLALGMLLLMFMSPLFLLVGAHPGFGRGVALKWAELLVGTVVKRITLGFLLAVLIGTFQIILGDPSLGFFTQTSMIIALGVAAIMYRKPMLEAFSVINLGGTRAGVERSDEAKRHAKKTAAFGVGALVGGIVGARGGGAGAALQGAARGGLMGQRGGAPTRAGMMGAAAGRRAASRAKADQKAKDRENDPLAYVNERQRESREQQRIDTLLQDEQWAGDEEFVRRVEQRNRKRGRDSQSGGAGSSNIPRPSAGTEPAAGGGVPRPDGGQPTAVIPSAAPDTAPASTTPAPAASGPVPRPSGTGEASGGTVVVSNPGVEDEFDAAARERGEASAAREEARQWQAGVSSQLEDQERVRRQQDQAINDAMTNARRIVADRDRKQSPPPGFSGGGAGTARRPDPGPRRPQ